MYFRISSHFAASRELTHNKHRRRLVINIGRAKIWVTNIGGANILRKYIFRQHSKKNLKNPLLFSKISEDLFFINNFFKKMTPFIQNVLPFLWIFLSLSLFLLSFMFYFLNNKKITNSCL